MVKISMHTAHLSFEMGREKDFFPLGYKVLQKQPISHAIRGLYVQYNHKPKLLYSIENLIPAAGVMEGLTEPERIRLFIDLLEAIRQTVGNGFLPKESVVVDADCLFWDPEKKALRLVVLPIQKEQEFEDGLSWVKRFCKTLKYLTDFLQTDKKEQLSAYFENIEAVPGDLEAAIHELNAMKIQNAGGAMEGHCADTFLPKLFLCGNSEHGNIRIFVDKPEFIIGKKQESVDGYLASSSSVSRMHCKILMQQNKYYCMDLGSLNHTYVNGLRAVPGEKLELHDKDILKLADIELQVQMTGGR